GRSIGWSTRCATPPPAGSAKPQSPTRLERSPHTKTLNRFERLFFRRSLPPIPRTLMRTLISSFLIATVSLALVPLPADPTLRGFFPQSVQAERDLEARFKAMPDPARMREAMRRLSARPHHV